MAKQTVFGLLLSACALVQPAGQVRGAVLLPGFVTTDLVISTDQALAAAQLVVALEEPGGIYQHPHGADSLGRPAVALFATLPELEFDSYVHFGSNDAEVTGCSSSLSALHNLDCNGSAIFDTDVINIAWSTLGSATATAGDVAVARITLKDTAAGAWSFQAIAAGNVEQAAAIRFEKFEIRDGRLMMSQIVPEPAALWLLVVGVLLMLKKPLPARC